VENKDETLTIATRGDPYSVTETTKPMLPTRSFRWRLSWNAKAETAAIMQNTTTTGIAIMATFTCNNVYSSQNVQQNGPENYSYVSQITFFLLVCFPILKKVLIVQTWFFFLCMKRVTWLTFLLGEENQK